MNFIFQNLIKLLVVYCCIVLIGCAAQNQLYENQDVVIPLMEETQSFYSGFSENSFYVYVSPKVNVLEFSKTFDNAFGTGRSLSNHIRLEFERNLDLIFDENHQVNIVDPLYDLDLMDDDDFYPELEVTVKYNEIDYLIFIQSLTINNKYSYGPSIVVSVPSGSVMPGISSSELCIIGFEVQLIDVKKWEIVNNFMVNGSKMVAFYDYETALFDAISNSISNALMYLKTGDTYYFK